MSSHYLRQFEETVNRLYDYKYFDIIDYRPGEPATQSELDYIESCTQLKLSDELKAIYLMFNGLYLEWTVQSHDIDDNASSDDELYGLINLLSLEETFLRDNSEHPWANILWFEHTPDEEKEDLLALRPYDWFNVDDRESICFRVEDGIVSDKLYYFHMQYGVLNLELGLGNYLDDLSNTAGLLESRRQYFLPNSNTMQRLQLLFR